MTKESLLPPEIAQRVQALFEAHGIDHICNTCGEGVFQKALEKARSGALNAINVIFDQMEEPSAAIEEDPPKKGFTIKRRAMNLSTLPPSEHFEKWLEDHSHASYTEQGLLQTLYGLLSDPYPDAIARAQKLLFAMEEDIDSARAYKVALQVFFRAGIENQCLNIPRMKELHEAFQFSEKDLSVSFERIIQYTLETQCDFEDYVLSTHPQDIKLKDWHPLDFIKFLNQILENFDTDEVLYLVMTDPVLQVVLQGLYLQESSGNQHASIIEGLQCYISEDSWDQIQRVPVRVTPSEI